MSILWFTLGLLSKPPVVVLPLVLLLGEALGVHHVGSSSGPLVHVGYPGNSGIATGTGLFPESTYPIPAFITKARGALAVLAPFFLLSLLFIMISMATEGGSIVDLPMVRRPFIAAAAICYYVSKAVVPIDIVPIHAKWNVGPTGLVWWAFLLAVAASGYIIIRFGTRVSREFLWGSGSFLFPLLPAIGIVGFGWLQLSYVGDHLAYFSIAGMGCCFAWVGMRGLESSRRGVRNANRCRDCCLRGSATGSQFHPGPNVGESGQPVVSKRGSLYIQRDGPLYAGSRSGCGGTPEVRKGPV